MPRRRHVINIPIPVQNGGISTLLLQDERHCFLTRNSVHLLIGQTSCNTSSVGPQAVSQEMDIIQRVVKFLLLEKRKKKRVLTVLCKRSKLKEK